MLNFSPIEWQSENTRLRRSLEFSNACHRAIICAETEVSLLQTICQLMIDQGGYQLAWVGYVGNDAAQTVQPIVHAGRLADREWMQAIGADADFWQCSIGQTLRSGELYLVQDIHPEDASWAQVLRQSGYRGLISLPLIEQNHVFGMLNLYTETAHHFHAEEIQLLSQLAADLSYAVTKLRADEVRFQTEQALLHAKQEQERLLAETIAARAEAINARDLLSSVFDRVNDGIIAFDNNSCFTYVNHSAASLLGLPAAELIGKHVWTEFSESLGKEFYHGYHQAVEQQTVISLEEYYEPWNRWFENRIYPGAQGVTLYFTEITEQKVAALAIAESEQRYASLAAAVPVGIFRTDAIGNCIYVNDRWSQISGLSMEAAMGSGWLVGLHPDDRELIQAEWYRAAQENRLFQLEYRFQRVDGQVSWVYGQASAELNEQGELLGYVGTVTDISDRKAAEAERLQAEQIQQELTLLEDIFDIVMAGYWEWDMPQHRHYMSYGWKRMLGYEADELPARPETWQELIFPEDLPVVMHHFEQHVQSRGQIPYYNEVRYRHKNGSTVWLICSGRVIEWDAAGNPLRMIGCHIDISDRKAVEAQLQQLNRELQRSNQDLEQFAYIASHDLQEPLRAIISYTQILMQDYGTVLSEPLAQESLSFIIDGGQRMRQLIQDLLAYSRIGSQTLNLNAVDSNHVLAEVLQNLQVQITESQAIITTDQFPTLYVDRTQFNQLLQNLISNALKFRRATPLQIHIGTMLLESSVETSSPKLSNPGQSVIFVRDNGIGIKPQYLDQIFDVFRRLHTRHQFPGTGIGLAICKKIVERHGGEIWVTSEWGEGSTFFFTLSANSDL